VIGAVVGIVVIATRKGGRKTKVPFGPFMFMGVYVAFAVGQSIVDWYVGSLGL
jgi:leader peptidase (prepilin peptidase) / N-methyltransferase